MPNTSNEMFEYLSKHISKSDIYAATAIAKISMFLFKYRREHNMTQKEFAKMMGVSQGMVSKWESAEYNFTIENIAQIAEKLKVTFEIEFAPESEYLRSRSKNEYTSFRKAPRKEPSVIASYIDAAA